MTVSKTVLLSMAFTRQGKPFAEVGAKSAIDITNISSYINKGLSIIGPSNDTTPIYPTIVNSPIRQGKPFNWSTAKATINASEFDYITQGQPFWVYYDSAPPPSYVASQFFIVF